MVLLEPLFSELGAWDDVDLHQVRMKFFHLQRRHGIDRVLAPVITRQDQLLGKVCRVRALLDWVEVLAHTHTNTKFEVRHALSLLGAQRPFQNSLLLHNSLG